MHTLKRLRQGMLAVACLTGFASLAMAAEPQALMLASTGSHAPAVIAETKTMTTCEIPLFRTNGGGLGLTGTVNHQESGIFLVDTGASYTVLSAKAAEKLGIQIRSDAPRARVRIGYGSKKLPVVFIKSLTIGRLKISDIQVAIRDMD
jgi:clan AA aspartic protease (TIGR02281 family)